MTVLVQQLSGELTAVCKHLSATSIISINALYFTTKYNSVAAIQISGKDTSLQIIIVKLWRVNIEAQFAKSKIRFAAMAF